jgi:nicotinamidase-related amidase
MITGSRMVDLASGSGMWQMGMVAVLVAGAVAWAALSPHEAGSPSVFPVWKKVKAPPPPDVESVTLEASTSALLILDIEERTCNPQRRPRAIASVPRIAELLERARNAEMPVVYSLTRGASAETILPQVTPREDEPVVASSVDKFYKTDLEKILRAKGVQRVLIVGTAAEGAVLHTATGAAMRGFDVFVAVDGISSSDLYAEQYTAWHLVNAPGSRRRTKLTETHRVQIE